MTSQYKNQKGAALYVVLITILLAMLISVWAARSAFFGEMTVSNNADYQRALEAAEALVQDAEFDITGSAAGTCIKITASPKVCRTGSTQKLPIEGKDTIPLLNALNTPTTKCIDALCAKRTLVQDWWNDPATFNAMQAVGARYGEYTGAQAKNDSNGAISNPILANTSSGRGGWYWIEILPYNQNAENSSLITGTTTNSGGQTVTTGAGDSILSVNAEVPVIYRITAIANGLRSNTRAIVQTSLILNKKIS